MSTANAKGSPILSCPSGSAGSKQHDMMQVKFAIGENSARTFTNCSLLLVQMLSFSFYMQRQCCLNWPQTCSDACQPFTLAIHYSTTSRRIHDGCVFR